MLWLFELQFLFPITTIKPNLKNLSLHRVFHSIRYKVNKLGTQRSPFFMPFTTATIPYSPTLSQITKPVATTPTIIWLISWNQLFFIVPLHQFKFHTFS